MELKGLTESLLSRAGHNRASQHSKAAAWTKMRRVSPICLGNISYSGLREWYAFVNQVQVQLQFRLFRIFLQTAQFQKLEPVGEVCSPEEPQKGMGFPEIATGV